MFPQSIQNLIDQLSKLPDIGPRAATRLAFYLINQDQKELDNLSSLIKDLKTKIRLCQNCHNLTTNESNLCLICSDQKRNKETICVVETVLNIPPIERTKQYNGLYHVLGGLISPGNGVGPEKLKINELVKRIKDNRSKVSEVIFALSPTTEGDTTTLYIERFLKPLEIKTSRLARGLSTGSDLEYIDENTLSSAFRGRS
jgi:recombination protein RecR